MRGIQTVMIVAARNQIDSDHGNCSCMECCLSSHSFRIGCKQMKESPFVEGAGEGAVTIATVCGLYCTLSASIAASDTTTATTATTITTTSRPSLDTIGSDVLVAAQYDQSRVLLPLRPDAEKKSVYWLDPPVTTHDIASATTAATCHIVSGGADCTHFDCTLQNSSSNSIGSNSTFYVGGFQLVSSAKQVEVYLTTAPGTIADATTTATTETEYAGKDVYSYLTTVRGIKVADAVISSKATDTDTHDDASSTTMNHRPLFKAMCVVPGGPRPVTAVRLKLLLPPPPPLSSSSPPPMDANATTNTGNRSTTTPQLQLQYVRWTLRCAPEQVEQQQQQQQQMYQPNEQSSATTSAHLGDSSQSSLSPEQQQQLLVRSTAAPSNGAPPPPLPQHDPFMPRSSNMMMMQQQQQQQQQFQQPAVSSSSSSDLGSAMAGLAFAIRATEERVVGQIVDVNRQLQSQLVAATHQIATLTAAVDKLLVLQLQQQAQQQQLQQQQLQQQQQQQQHDFATLQETVTSLLQQHHQEVLRALTAASAQGDDRPGDDYGEPKSGTFAVENDPPENNPGSHTAIDEDNHVVVVVVVAEKGETPPPPRAHDAVTDDAPTSSITLLEKQVDEETILYVSKDDELPIL